MPRCSRITKRLLAVAAAAVRWCNAGFPPRVRALERIALRTGYSTPVVEYALDRLFGAITTDALAETIARELRDRAVRPVGRVAVISSRTTIGVAIVPAIFALCAGCDVVVKDREDGLVAAFFESLTEELSEFADAANARSWDARSESGDLHAYDAVVAFGGNDALQAIRARLAPSARFIPYGPKASVGYVAREALRAESDVRRIAEGAARDFLLYDGEGCLSLHALFIERDGSVTVDAFARILESAVEAAAVEFPLGSRDPATALAVANHRDLALFRGSILGSNERATYVLERGSADEPPTFLPRVLALHAVDEPGAMRAYAARHHLPLEACAVAGVRDDVVAAAVDAGANRIAPFGEMQAPPLSYPHGGRPRIAEFVRFIAEAP